MTHDPLCPQPAYDQPRCGRCQLIARVRADEHRKSANANAVMGYMRGAVDDFLADLRAKVEGLPSWHQFSDDVVSRAAVLALLDEVQQ